jgi:hypothetical protein
MKISNGIFLITICISYTIYSSAQSEGNSFIIDETKAVIYSPDKSIVITLADTQKPSIMGTDRSVKRLLFEFLVFLNAQTLNMNIPEDMIVKYLEQIQKNNGLSLNQFEHMLKEAGYTLESFKQELERFQMVGQMLDFKVYSKAVVTQEEIARYYNEHPETQEARYYIRIAFVPLNDSPNQKRDIQNHLTFDKTLFEWQEPFWIKKSEIAKNKAFITTLEVAETWITKTNENFIIYELITKEEERITSLEVRYEEIVQILKEPTAQKLFEQYENEVLKEGTFILIE